MTAVSKVQVRRCSDYVSQWRCLRRERVKLMSSMGTNEHLRASKFVRMTTGRRLTLDDVGRGVWAAEMMCAR